MSETDVVVASSILVHAPAGPTISGNVPPQPRWPCGPRGTPDVMLRQKANLGLNQMGMVANTDRGWRKTIDPQWNGAL